jgi:hypothetical protein
LIGVTVSVANVAPAGIVALPVSVVKSVPAVAVPLTEKLTSSEAVVRPVRVILNEPGADGSAAAASNALTVTVGSASSLVISTVALLGVPTM